VVVDNTVFPDMLFWTFSLEATIMCLLGGWLTFLGPLLGAAIIVVIRTFASTYTVYWGLVLSIIFVLVIFFLPNGILGWIQELYQRRTKLAEVKE
jgi:branched-chain amino acid transport system permease protein